METKAEKKKEEARKAETKALKAKSEANDEKRNQTMRKYKTERGDQEGRLKERATELKEMEAERKA
jgi:hypothetical protein